MWNQKKEMEEMTKRSSKTKCCIFAWSCENFAKPYEMVQKAAAIAVAVAPLISYNNVKLIFFMQNGYFAAKLQIVEWRRSWKTF